MPGRARAGLGAGDAKLFAAGGAWAGWASLPHILLAASAGALLAVLAQTWLAGKRIGPTDRLAFGPYLAAGIWATWLAGAA